MNCKNIVKELSNYLEEALEPSLKASIEKHLEGCEDCRIVVDTTKKTIQIFCNSEPAPLPEDTRQRLRDALFKQLSHIRRREALDAAPLHRTSIPSPTTESAVPMRARVLDRKYGPPPPHPRWRSRWI